MFYPHLMIFKDFVLKGRRLPAHASLWACCLVLDFSSPEPDTSQPCTQRCPQRFLSQWVFDRPEHKCSLCVPGHRLLPISLFPQADACLHASLLSPEAAH